MEADSSNLDLMDMNEYLIDDWDFDFPFFEGSNDHNPETTKNNHPHDISATGGVFASVCERQSKQPKRINVAATYNESSPPSSSSSPPQLLCFENYSPSPPNANALNFSDLFDVEQCGQGSSKKEDHCRPGKKQPHLLKENAIAEKKRRQKLNERLIALSALLPGLKKSDKVTVLDDAIKHMKQLQERIKQLEQELIPANNTMESVIRLEKSQVNTVKDSSSASLSFPSDEGSNGQSSDQMLPHVEATVSNNDILIRIHCEKSKGCVNKILNEMDKLRLEVINSFTFPLGNSTFHITILAKMDNNFPRLAKDVVKNIRLAMVD